jgi:hypothetical protein
MDTEELIADESLQETGVWIPFRDGCEFLIAYSGRKKYRDRIGKTSARLRRMNRGRELTTGEIDQVNVEAMVGTVLLDWKGITKEGQPFPFTAENAKWWLSKSTELRDFIFGEAATIGNFQKEGEAASDKLADLKSGSDISAGKGQGTGSTDGRAGNGNGSPDTAKPS